MRMPLMLCKNSVILVLLAFSVCPKVNAQTPPDIVAEEVQDEANEIVVVGSNSNFKLSGKSLKAMVDAFTKDAPEFAPASRLLFQVQSVQSDLRDVSLSLRMDDELADIILDNNGIFSLPALKGKPKNIQLISNRPKTSIQIKPLIYSSTYTPYSRRMGDLRLECRVLWAGYKSNISIFLQAAFGVAGGCNSSNIGIYSTAPVLLKSVMIDGIIYDRPGTLSRDGLKYRAPIYDKKIGNDALLTLTAIN
jgi:hypothetical protein